MSATGRRLAVLAVLRAATAPLGVAEIADQLDVHPNTVRFHLHALLQTGQVERVPGAPLGPGRPALAFRSARAMDPGGPRNYQLLAGALVESLAGGPDPGERSLAAGRRWGAQLAGALPPRRGRGRGAAVAQLVGLLEDLGFEPEQRPRAAGPGSIALRNCPFLELVEGRTQVVCPIHLGLMQGALSAVGAPVTVERLEPFVEPDRCLAHLAHLAVTPDGA